MRNLPEIFRSSQPSTRSHDNPYWLDVRVRARTHGGSAENRGYQTKKKRRSTYFAHSLVAWYSRWLGKEPMHNVSAQTKIEKFSKMSGIHGTPSSNYLIPYLISLLRIKFLIQALDRSNALFATAHSLTLPSWRDTWEIDITGIDSSVRHVTLSSRGNSTSLHTSTRILVRKRPGNQKMWRSNLRTRQIKLVSYFCHYSLFVLYSDNLNQYYQRTILKR